MRLRRQSRLSWLSALAGSLGYEVLESRNQSTRRVGPAVLGDRRGGELAGRPTARPCQDRRVGWCTGGRELQRQSKRDRHDPGCARTSALPDRPRRRARSAAWHQAASAKQARDTGARGCGARPEASRRDERRPAAEHAPTLARGCAAAPLERTAAHQPTACHGRKQADFVDLARREAYGLESDSFPRAHVRRAGSSSARHR